MNVISRPEAQITAILRRTRLLHNMREFVGQGFTTGSALGNIRTGAEENVRSNRESARVHSTAQNICLGVMMNAHIVEITPQTRFKFLPHTLG